MGQSKISLVNNMIHRKFFFLEEKYGYIPYSKEVESTFFDESLHVEYVSINLQRKININYNRSLVDEIDTYTFSMSIIRLPYTGVKDFFSLNVYFRTNRIIFTDQLIHNFSFEGAELILDNLAEFSMKTEEIRKILEGNKWLDTYYPEWN